MSNLPVRLALPVTPKTHMDSYFASPERSSPEQLQQSSRIVASDPVLAHILECVGGMIAILDENRQILAANLDLLDRLNVPSAERCLGLRPGEAFGCAHAHDMPAGCGTSRWCRSCGAALAIVASLGGADPAERECAMQLEGQGELFLRVRCSPIEREGRKFLALFLQDITHEQRLSMLERTFFHDIKGLVTGVLGYGELLQRRTDEQSRPLVEALQRVTSRLANEIGLQAQLIQGQTDLGSARYSRVRAKTILQDLRTEFHQHPLHEERKITYEGSHQSQPLITDPGLVVRVLHNMVLNALEASLPGEEIRVGFREEGSQAVFSVWNARLIDPDVQQRIFQRNFSTKASLGRGLGTWSMKFFGEELLRGEVGFCSTPESGTTFTLRLQMHSDAT